jgi:hypothetical protein
MGSPSPLWSDTSSPRFFGDPTTVSAVATFEIESGDLCLRLSWLEKLEASHGNLRIPLASVSSVRSVTTAWPELRGIRAPGTGIPNVVAVGTRRGRFGKDFAVVHGKGPAVVVELEGARYRHLIVTVADPDATAATIRGGMHR